MINVKISPELLSHLSNGALSVESCKAIEEELDEIMEEDDELPSIGDLLLEYAEIDGYCVDEEMSDNVVTVLKDEKTVLIRR